MPLHDDVLSPITPPAEGLPPLPAQPHIRQHARGRKALSCAHRAAFTLCRRRAFHAPPVSGAGGPRGAPRCIHRHGVPPARTKTRASSRKRGSPAHRNPVPSVRRRLRPGIRLQRVASRAGEPAVPPFTLGNPVVVQRRGEQWPPSSSADRTARPPMRSSPRRGTAWPTHFLRRRRRKREQDRANVRCIGRPADPAGCLRSGWAAA